MQSVWHKPGTADLRIGASAIQSREATDSLSLANALLPLLLLLALSVQLRTLLPPWAFMWALAFSLFFGLKWATWWRVKDSVPHSPWRAAAYLFAWPGMDADSFLDSAQHPPRPTLAEWCWAIFKTSLGVALLWFIARQIPPNQPLLRGWLGMLGLIFLLHFGSFHILALFWQSIEIDAKPIMRCPLRAHSLSEFWGKRWNLGFRQFAHDLVFLPAHKYLPVELASFMVFLVSGLIHDLVISVPAKAGYGLPTAYFILQGLGVIVERSPVGKRIGLGNGLRGFLFLLLIATGPLFWLFHPPFVLRVIVPFMQEVRAL
jgi:hypothetical protein